jgi:osmotically inducible lipoprotein OsmB
MTSERKILPAAMAVVLLLGGCATLSPRDRNTVIGAGVGAVTGSVLTGGDSLGTVGGGVVGGVIGHEVNPYRPR